MGKYRGYWSADAALVPKRPKSREEPFFYVFYGEPGDIRLYLRGTAFDGERYDYEKAYADGGIGSVELVFDCDDPKVYRKFRWSPERSSACLSIKEDRRGHYLLFSPSEGLSVRVLPRSDEPIRVRAFITTAEGGQDQILMKPVLVLRSSAEVSFPKTLVCSLMVLCSKKLRVQPAGEAYEFADLPKPKEAL